MPASQRSRRVSTTTSNPYIRHGQPQSHHRPLIGRFALAPPGRRARPTSWNRFATRSLDISRSMPLHPRSSTSESDEAEKIGRQSQRSPDRIPNLRRRARTSVDIKVEPASPPTRTPSPVPIYPSPSLMNSPSEEVPMALIPVSPIVFESNLDLPLLERPTYKSPTSTPTTSEIITPPRSKTISLPPFHCPGDQRLGDRQVIDRAVDVGDQMQTRTVPLMSDHQAFTRAVRRVQEALSALANSLEPSPTTVEREAQVPDVGITVTTEDVSAADDHAFFQAWDVSLGEASTEATNSDAFDSPTNPSASPHEPLATSNVDRVSQSSKSLPMPTGPPIPLAFGKFNTRAKSAFGETRLVSKFVSAKPGLPFRPPPSFDAAGPSVPVSRRASVSLRQTSAPPQTTGPSRCLSLPAPDRVNAGS